MGDITNLDDHRPHAAQYVACMACAHDWVAVFPINAAPLECPRCGAMDGDAVRTDDVDWFKRFMAGGSQRTRTLVMLNAQRMGL